MATERRIDATQAYKKTVRGEALLVCAGPDEFCEQDRLHGAMTRAQLESLRESLPRDQEIIVYDGGDEEDASREAEALASIGFEAVRVLIGGARNWKLTGYPLAAETPPQNPPS